MRMARMTGLAIVLALLMINQAFAEEFCERGGSLQIDGSTLRQT